MNVSQIIQTHRSGLTTRYHQNRSVMHHTVAQHTWGVVALIFACHPKPSHALLKAATFHDCGERFGPGDISYLAKRDTPELKALSDMIEEEALSDLGLFLNCLTHDELRWLKWADMAELGLHSMDLHKDCLYPVALKSLGEACDVLVNYDDLGEKVSGINATLCGYHEEQTK